MAKRTRISILDDDKEMYALLQNTKDIKSEDRLHKISLMALRNVISTQLTARQKQYLVLYYYNNVDMPTIAKQYGVNKSTVSRTINRARHNIYRYIQYYFNKG